jgi:hypothetical protein
MPAEATNVPTGSIARAIDSAMGERTAFMRHMNRIERGSGNRAGTISRASGGRRPA